MVNAVVDNNNLIGGSSTTPPEIVCRCGCLFAENMLSGGDDGYIFS